MTKVVFKQGDRMVRTVDVASDKSLMEVAQEADIQEIEGACGGSLACASCHVVLDQATYDRLAAKYPVSPEESDMLDLAFGRTPTSRLSCQILIRKADSDMDVFLP